MTQEVTPEMRAVALKALEAWKALPEDERNGERPFIMGFNAGWDEGKADAHTEAAELKARVDALEGALQTVVDALVKHHQWHAAQTQPDPEHRFVPADEYAESGLCEQTVGALHAAGLVSGPYNFSARQALGGVS